MLSPTITPEQIAALVPYMTPAERRELDGLLAPYAPLAPSSYGAWLKTARPKFQWDAPHFVAMQAVLDDITAGRKKRAYFQVPIRHGKTEHNTVGYITYRLKREPSTRVLLASYNQRRAEKFSRQVLRLVQELGLKLSSTKNGASEWETAVGGGVQVVGAGAGVASVNADLIVVDDPIGSRADAESPAVRESVWDWLTSDILARCEPHTAVVMTMSRWHEDDPAGRLLKEQKEQWTVVDLPAEAEENDPLGREPGEPLWPEHRGREWLEEKKRELGAYSYASLLQGRPRPRSGGMFKTTDWGYIHAMPLVNSYIRYWDTAGTEAKRGSDPDYTVGVLGCRMADGRTVIIDVARFRLGITERDLEMQRVAREDKVRCHGRAKHWIESEAGIGGAARTQHLKRLLQNAGVATFDERPSTDKVTRAEPLASAVGAGNVLLCPGDWHGEFLREFASFPTGSHDDQTDATASLFNKLNQAGSGNAPATADARETSYGQLPADTYS